MEEQYALARELNNALQSQKAVSAYLLQSKQILLFGFARKNRRFLSLFVQCAHSDAMFYLLVSTLLMLHVVDWSACAEKGSDFSMSTAIYTGWIIYLKYVLYPIF